MSTIRAQILAATAGKPIVVRVLLRFDTIVYRYPDFGVWCYLIHSRDGIVVFDPGPRYVSLLGYPVFKRETGNATRILATLDTYFPGIPVAYIAASHYHFDHTENAPLLSSMLVARGQKQPPIRLHKKEWERKTFLHVLPTSLGSVLRRAGSESWVKGTPIVDGEHISGTSMVYTLLAGHTSGNIAIVDSKRRMLIGGYWGLGRSMMHASVARITQFTDECPSLYKKTKQQLREYAGYRLYTYHPVPGRRHQATGYTVAAV